MFVSYAQNFEDVMLWRALKDIVHGFYIDIGAQDPMRDSVSMAFYEHGWRGIHVEPTRQYAEALRQARPDELVEQLAVGYPEGVLAFYEFEDTGLSTADPEIAQRHQLAGYQVRETQVPCITMDELLARAGGRIVHWLKIDVEGFEKQVLDGWRNSPVRPWILVIESTRPLSSEATSASWEELVIAKGYSFAYFDGLNRFYVHNSQPQRLSAFSAPPNVFDNFAHAGLSSSFIAHIDAAEGRIAQLLAELDEAQQKSATEVRDCEAILHSRIAHIDAAEGRIAQLLAELDEAQQKSATEVRDCEARLQAILHSRSWRLTKPLRIFGRAVSLLIHLPKRVLRRSLQVGANILRRTVGASARAILERPALKRWISPWVSRFPRLRLQLVDIVRESGSTQKPMVRHSPMQITLTNLNIRARGIYADIRATIDDARRFTGVQQDARRTQQKNTERQEGGGR